MAGQVPQSGTRYRYRRNQDLGATAPRPSKEETPVDGQLSLSGAIYGYLAELSDNEKTVKEHRHALNEFEAWTVANYDDEITCAQLCSSGRITMRLLHHGTVCRRTTRSAPALTAFADILARIPYEGVPYTPPKLSGCQKAKGHRTQAEAPGDSAALVKQEETKRRRRHGRPREEIIPTVLR